MHERPQGGCFMTKLRQRMIEELRLRNSSEETIRSYIDSVKRFARYYHTSPDRMNAEQVRSYLLYLLEERKLSWSAIHVNRAALRFLYVRVLRQRWFDEEIQAPKRHLIGELSQFKREPHEQPLPLPCIRLSHARRIVLRFDSSDSGLRHLLHSRVHCPRPELVNRRSRLGGGANLPLGGFGDAPQEIGQLFHGLRHHLVNFRLMP